MKKASMRTLPIIVMLSLWAGNAIAASFDCAKASDPTEKAICASDALSALDEQTALLYSRQLAADASSNWKDYLKFVQKDWLKDRNQICKADVECLKRDYELRNQFYLSQPLLPYTGRYIQGNCPNDGLFMDVTATRDSKLHADVYICPDPSGNMLLQTEVAPNKEGASKFAYAGCQYALTFKQGVAELSVDAACKTKAASGTFRRDPARNPDRME
jgi:uncharacterized protein YecT (DUF1311 family)